MKCSMQKKIESVGKKSEILTSLEPRFDSRKSFYGKAQVEDDGNSKTLYSYNTPVARVTDGKLELLPKWNFSQTTRRHVADFVKQMGVEDQYLKLKKGESKKHTCSMQKKTESFKITEAARKYYNTEDWWKRLQDDYNDMYDGLGFEFKFNGPEKMVDIYSNGKKWGSISWKGQFRLLDEDGEWLYKSPAPEIRDFLYHLAEYHGENLNDHYNGTIAKRSW